MGRRGVFAPKEIQKRSNHTKKNQDMQMSWFPEDMNVQ